MFAQDLGFMIYDPTGFGNVTIFKWSAYFSWFFYVVMVVMIIIIIMSIAKKDAKDNRVKVLFVVVIPSGILVSMWSLFVIALPQTAFL